MSEIDYARDDTVDAALFFAHNPLARGQGGISELLRAIDTHAGALRPDQVVGTTVMPYSHAAAERLIGGQRGRSKIVLDLVRSADPEVLYEMSFVADEPVECWLRIIVPLTYFADPATVDARSRDFVALLRALALAGPSAVYGYAHGKGDLALGSDPHTGDPFAPLEVYEAYWLNLYGAQMVDSVGRARVLSTPAASVEELPDGGVLLLTRPTPMDYAADDARLAQARALAHLRDGVSLDDALDRLRARSATLAPVERRWDPDVADVLALMLDSVSYSDRQRETERLNDYRPPDVSEWRPLSDLLPADVTDPDETVALYGDRYAERLAALLHRDVPAAFDAGPDGLPRIDYHFWHFDYPGSFPRADIENALVPAVGAYLGELLVTHLGGRWVPRRDLDESQVVVGDRAWLPFLRARHYLRDRQSVLDHSLTQFYRVAARSR